MLIRLGHDYHRGGVHIVLRTWKKLLVQQMGLQLLTLVGLAKLTWTLLVLVDMMLWIVATAISVVVVRVASLCMLRVVPVARAWMQLRKALWAYAREPLWLVLLSRNAWLPAGQASWPIHTLLAVVHSLVRCRFILRYILEDNIVAIVAVDWQLLILRPSAPLVCLQQVLAAFFQMVLSRQARVESLLEGLFVFQRGRISDGCNSIIRWTPQLIYVLNMLTSSDYV